METTGDRAAAEAAAVDLGRCRSLGLLLPDPHPSQSFPKGYTIRTRDIWLRTAPELKTLSLTFPLSHRLSSDLSCFFVRNFPLLSKTSSLSLQLGSLGDVREHQQAEEDTLFFSPWVFWLSRTFYHFWVFMTQNGA